jgi:hypothetical protein
MKRSSRRRVKRRAMSTKNGAAPPSSLPPPSANSPPPPGSPPPPEPTVGQSWFRTWWQKRVSKWWSVVAAILGFVISLFGLIFPIYDHLPRIDIQPATELDENDPSSTLFRITNIGSWTVRDIHVSCTLFDGMRTFTITHGHVKHHGVSIFGGIEKMSPDNNVLSVVTVRS